MDHLKMSKQLTKGEEKVVLVQNFTIAKIRSRLFIINS